MFDFLIWGVIVVVALAILYAYTMSRDVFHPLMFIGPMMVFMYGWMPLKLHAAGSLDGFFQQDQLEFVQAINLAGILAFVLGCLSVGCQFHEPPPERREVSPNVLLICGAIVGLIGLAAYAVLISNAGGLSAAYGQQSDSVARTGGWDDNGYVRDSALLMFPGFLLILTATFKKGFRLINAILMACFIVPWMMQAVLTARRGPTFMIAVIIAMGWYLNKGKRPSLLLTAVSGLVLGTLMLFLVINRTNIYLGSDTEMKTDISSMVDKPDTGNEFIYGSGTLLASEQRNSFYWGRRYLAQVVVRPIPSAIWPTKYEDFGLAELQYNGGTGEGFAETLGWVGAEGSAPGIIADLWLEFRWLNILALLILGRLFGWVWKKAVTEGGPWMIQYVFVSALSIYFVMQTMEAVIFRMLLISIPMWISWRIAEHPQPHWATQNRPYVITP